MSDESMRPSSFQAEIMQIVRRIVGLFVSIIFLVVLLYVALQSASLYLALSDTGAGQSPGSQYEAGELQAEQNRRILKEQLDYSFKIIQPVIDGIWALLKPVLQLAVVLLLLRWVFSNTKLGDRISSSDILTEESSLIAVLVIGSICLLPLIDQSIPEILGNIALVIVGFYFGDEARKRVQNTNSRSKK